MKTVEQKLEYFERVKRILVNIDMINGFVKEGSLAAPSIMRVVPRQIELMEDAITRDDTGIIFIRDSHKENAPEFKNYPPHCLEGTKESEVINELQKYKDYALEYLKNSTNLIFAPRLQELLILLMKYGKLEILELMGCLSEICVLNGAIGLKTFLDQKNSNIDVAVHADAIDTFDAPDHNADIVTADAIKHMQSNGIKILRKTTKGSNI